MVAARKSPSLSRFASVKTILQQMILCSVRVKAHVVSADEREGGLRNLLNYGHSIGHAIEAILTPEILHGECVAIGMMKEAELSRHLVGLSPSAVGRLGKCLLAYGLPINLEDKLLIKRSRGKRCEIEKILQAMSIDKKNDGKTKKIVLLKRIGETSQNSAVAVSEDAIKYVLSHDLLLFPSVPEATVTIQPPGSKSISNRALVLAALGKGSCRLQNLLHSDDTQFMMSALRDLQGATFSWEGKGESLVVEGHEGHFSAPADEIYLGNAGTAARFLTTLALLVTKSTENDTFVLTGNARMKQRPIGPLIQALSGNGTPIDYLGNEGSLPLRFDAQHGFKGGLIELAATMSSQYVSSLLMCAPYARQAVTLKLIGGKPVSQPYIDMTLAMMHHFGISVIKSDQFTYHVPLGTYQNPAVYTVESDASSATYPLAMAAIHGTKCTVTSIGCNSLQGDARFALDVLRPMGCVVEQDDFATTVQGPARGSLLSIPSIDMENMTDAFLTASVLAAVATNEPGTSTKITGIANQRVKECNRIEAMIHELYKFGIKTTELPDGIEIHGNPISSLQSPHGGVLCYDDHRIAMSFAVLASVCPKPVLLQDKKCVDKTWPSWWDDLSSYFRIHLSGTNHTTHPIEVLPNGTGSRKSLLIIGMRGAGKTTLGKWAADILNFEFTDFDAELERRVGMSIPEFFKINDWTAFRREESELLKYFLASKKQGCVAACGGGVVEEATNRALLKSFMDEGGTVLLVHRDTKAIVQYLNLDESRPAYVEDIMSVWERRKGWYKDCSSREFYSLSMGEDSESRGQVFKDISRFLMFTTGRVDFHSRLTEKTQSYFVSLTFPDLLDHVLSLPAICEGCDAVELRVDMMTGAAAKSGHTPVDYIARQVAILRRYVTLPILFTIRTKAQGGMFPSEDVTLAADLIRNAFRWGVEYVDLESSWPSAFRSQLLNLKGKTKIIASHHDNEHLLPWDHSKWETIYDTLSNYGDIVKLVGVAETQSDNLGLEFFKRSHKSGAPLICINMGRVGQATRISNEFLTPVSHPLMPTKAAPGQLSLKEINEGRYLNGFMEKKSFYLFGSPISHSRSPLLHNSWFQMMGLPHEYKSLETRDANNLNEKIKADSFGGASVTIPLKLDVMRFMGGLSPAARSIGAVNTIVPQGNNLYGENTDWRGMCNVLVRHRGPKPLSGSGLVVGAGGTARAAVYALHYLGLTPIYLVNRSMSTAEELIAQMSDTYQVEIMDSVQAAHSLAHSPTLAIGTVPADKELDPAVLGILKEVLRLRGENVGGVFLEMAYKPKRTQLMELAERLGWKTIPGLSVLVEQATEQFHLWTGIKPTALLAESTLLGDE